MPEDALSSRIQQCFAERDDGLIYVNHAAMSPWPLPTRLAVEEFARENALRGPLAYAAWLQLESELRQRIARLLNAESADDIALLPNTSAGVNVVANGIDWRAGDNIVSCAGEFPTNHLAWAALEARGVELRSVDIRAAGDAEAALLARVDARTRVLTVSSVQWNDGFRLDLQRLGAACSPERTLLFADAIQQFGALPLDVRAAGVHCLAAGSHKWQMGPEGMGVFYCHPALRERLSLAQFGWRMFADPYRFDQADRSVADSARRFEAGSPNTMGQVALHASLGVLEEFGMAEVGQRVLANSQRLFAATDSIVGLEAVSRTDPQRRSGIVALRSTRGAAVALNRALKLRKVSAVVRGDALRLSPHFYQHGTVMDRLLNALEDAAASL